VTHGRSSQILTQKVVVHGCRSLTIPSLSVSSFGIIELTVNILFIDDTGQNKDKYVGIGGVIFQDECINNLFGMFRSKKEAYGIPAEEEIKWSPRRNSWIFENLRDDRRISAYSDILKLVGMHGGTVMVAVLQRDVTSFDLIQAKWKCIEFITERFQFFLQAREDKNGIIIADVPGSGRDEKKLLSDYYLFLDKGTSYVKPSNIIMNLLTTKSHLNPGLQIADLIIGITTAMCIEQSDFASNFWPIVKDNLYRNREGSVAGCGLKIFPEETAEDAYERLFPEDFEEEYEEYKERMRYLYKEVLGDDVDLYF